MSPNVARAEMELERTCSRRRQLSRSRVNATTVAAIAVAVSLVALVLVGIVAIYQRDQIRSVSMRQCEAGNAARYGGSDYSRPLIRQAMRRHGDGDLADELDDIPQIDCSTGKPIPLPAGAQR